MSHKSVIQLIRQNVEDLRDFGNLPFEMRNSVGAGRHTKYALLTEPQATLLLTFMRNSPKVKYFKVLLVKEFYRMREQLKNTQVPAQLSRMEIPLLVSH
ncbi:MAG: Rha family transcriptional regulator [Candidatus Thiodiazotropha endolucinida]